MKRLLASLLLVSTLAGCSTPGPHSATIDLTATLRSANDIELEWTDTAGGAEGYTVEWTADPKSEYVVLAFLPPHVRSYTHPDLMAEMTCHYRVRPFYGPASSPVEVKLPEGLSEATYVARYDQPEDFEWALPRIVPEANPVAKKSIRNPTTAADAVPTVLKAELVPITVSGFKLTWTDRARDEEGCFLEMKPEGQPDFLVQALVEPDINSFGYAFAPPVRKGSFRVRAFYYGRPSNRVSQITGRAADSRF